MGSLMSQQWVKKQKAKRKSKQTVLTMEGTKLLRSGQSSEVAEAANSTHFPDDKNHADGQEFQKDLSRPVDWATKPKVGFNTSKSKVTHIEAKIPNHINGA